MTTVRSIAWMALLVGCSRTAASEPPYVPRDGDLIFQMSRSRQSAAVEAATRSQYTHMGIVFVNGGDASVLEAVEPVRWTPLAEWIHRGRSDHYVVKRLRNAEALLTRDAISRLRTEGERYLGRHYDTHFGWSDDRWYCSELAWKMYARTLQVEIGAPQAFAELNLSHPAVKKLMARRHTDRSNSDERVITPVAMMDSPLLVEVGRWGDGHAVLAN